MMIQNQKQSLLIMIDPLPLQTWSVIEEQNNTWYNTNNAPNIDNNRSYR